MKISYVTDYNAQDVHEWSGLGYYIAKALEGQQVELDYVGGLVNKFDNFFKAKQLCYMAMGKRYLRDRETVITRSYAEQVLKKVNPLSDVIFSPGSIPIAFVKSEKPKVFYTDSTFAGMINYYDAFSNLCSETIRCGHELEQEALDTCSLAIYSCDWAAQSAIDYYKASPDKIKVVPFGANIVSNRTIHDIRQIIDTKSAKVCRLLFLGVDWERKGGDIALETARLLNENGLETELHIVGIKKLPLKEVPSYIKSHGFISKASDEGIRKFNNLIAQSHFLILPTRADCTPVVFSEACSFGLPSLTTNTGGISTIIKDEVNGKTFDLTSPAGEYAKYILQKFNNYSEYKVLSLSSFEDYQNRLNWRVSGRKIVDLIKEL